MSKPIKLGRAVSWAYIMNWTDQGISAALVFLLASIVGPHDFGIVAMAMIFAMFLDIFLDQGFTTALIQRKDLEPQHLVSVFWILVTSSLILVVITIFTSGWWAKVNHVPELALILNVLTLRLPIGALSRVQNAIFQRELNYKSLAARNSIAVIGAGLTGISLALLDYGPWAIVGQQLAKEVIGTVVIWRLCPWRPSMKFSLHHAKQLISFSRANLFAKLGGFTINYADALLVGIFFGPTAVGVYRLASRIVDLTLQLLTKSLQMVSLPELSRHQNNREKLRSSTLKLLKTGITTSFPTLAIIAACSYAILSSIGSEWKDASNILVILCIHGALQSIVMFGAPILQATSRASTHAILTWTQGAICVSVYFVVSKTLPPHFDEIRQLEILAAGKSVIIAIFALPIFLWLSIPPTGVKSIDIVKMSWPSVCSATVAFAAGTAINILSRSLAILPIFQLILTAGASALLAIATLATLDYRMRSKLLELLPQIRAFYPSISTHKSPK